MDRAKRLTLQLAGTALAAGVPSLAHADRNDGGKPRLLSGPMVGAVGEQEVTIWARASGPYRIAVEFDTDPYMSNARVTDAVTAREEDDYCVHLRLTGLKPGTTYFYAMRVEDGSEPYQSDLMSFPVRTAPAPDQAKGFSVAFGSCARYQEDAEQPVWDAVAARRPDLFFWLGDNMYIDTVHAHVFAEEYRQQRNVPRLQKVIRSVPQLAIWDDHDYGLNDHDRENPLKSQALTNFKRYWANPSYGLPDTPGVFFTYSYGGIDFFFIDGRTYRDPNADPDGPDKTHLGSEQKAWLFESLKNSQAPFKVIASGSGWSKGKGHGGDSWSSTLMERDEIFDFIRDNDIRGVVLLSGDTHVAELNCIPWSETGGYDMYDLVSSPLAQNTTDSWLERRPERRIRQVFFGSPNFGLIHFELSEDPALTYMVIDTKGQSCMRPFTVKASELRNGVSTWREKMDSLSLHRHESEAAGGPYYIPIKS